MLKWEVMKSVVQLQTGFRTWIFKVPTSTLVLLVELTSHWLFLPLPAQAYSTVKGPYLFLVYVFLRPSKKVQLLFYWQLINFSLISEIH